MKQSILSLILFSALAENIIQASQNHSLHNIVQAWLNECHRANLVINSSSLTPVVQNQECSSGLPEGVSPAVSPGLSKGGARFSVSSSSSEQDERGEQIDNVPKKDNGTTELYDQTYFVGCIKNPELWKNYLKIHHGKMIQAYVPWKTIEYCIRGIENMD